MDKPYVSPDFNMDDIRRIRDYNSARHSTMTHKEIMDDIQKGANEMSKKLADYKAKKEIADGVWN